MKKVIRSISRDRDPKVKVKGQIMYFLVTASPPKPLDVATSNIAAAYVSRCRGHSPSNLSCDIYIKFKGQIVYFLVNASPPKPLDVATSNFAGA